MASLTKDIETTVQASILDKLQENVNNNVIKPKLTTIDKVGGIYCHICKITFSDKKVFTEHYKIHGEEEVIYTCVVCHKQIKIYPSFRAHCYTVHVVGSKHRCQHCYKAFSNSASLDDHIKANHSQPFQCSVCLKKFTIEQELQLHQIIHDNKDSPPYNCQICNLLLPTLDCCKNHAVEHTMLIYYCPICNENINKENATEHLKKHFDNNSHHEDTTEANTKDKNATEVNIKDNNVTEVNPKDKNTTEEHDFDNAETGVEHMGIACDYCTGVFKNKVEFDGHFSEDHEELAGEDLVYVCVACKKKFNKYSKFASHVYNHTVKARFSCNICHKRFGRLSMLATHTAVCEADPESGKPFACSECGHRYIHERSLRQHLQAKHGIRRVRCPVEDCSKTFATTKELIVHQYNHKSEQTWCRRCGMLFTSLAACEQHLEVHRQKLHSCPICSRDYPEKYTLMNHIVQHFESVILICKICGKVFNQRRRFMYHMETHSDNHIHKCTYCSKGFRTPAQLRVHLNSHTGSKPYKCAVCHKAFGNYANLSKHKRRMHMKLKGVTSYSHHPTPKDDAKIYSKSVDEDEFTTNDATNKNNNLNTPKIDNTLPQSNQTKPQKNCVLENKISETRHPTSDATDESNLESIDDYEFITSDIIGKNNNLNTLKIDKKLAGSNQRKRPTNNVLQNIISKKSHSTSDAKIEITSGNLEEGKFITSHANLKEAKKDRKKKIEILDIQYLYPNNTVKHSMDHMNTEPDPIDCIDLEKELQFLEHISKSENDGDAVYGDVLSTSNTVFDYGCTEGLPNTGSSEKPNYPQEYGPEFAIQDCGILNLDDHMLPHIDPLLTIKTVDHGTHSNCLLPTNIDAGTYQEYQTPAWEPPIFTKVCPDYSYDGNSAFQEYQAPGWQPPVFTKVCPEYSYYGDMVDSNRTSMLNTDIF